MIKNVKKKLWLVGGHALASCRRPGAPCRAGPPLRRAVKPPCCCAACLCLPAGGRGGSRWPARTRRRSTRRPAHALLRYDPPSVLHAHAASYAWMHAFNHQFDHCQLLRARSDPFGFFIVPAWNQVRLCLDAKFKIPKLSYWMCAAYAWSIKSRWNKKLIA